MYQSFKEWLRKPVLTNDTGICSTATRTANETNGPNDWARAGIWQL